MRSRSIAITSVTKTSSETVIPQACPALLLRPRRRGGRAKLPTLPPWGQRDQQVNHVKHDQAAAFDLSEPVPPGSRGQKQEAREAEHHRIRPPEPQRHPD